MSEQQQNFNKPFVHHGKHRVPYGIPESSINFTDENAMSNLETIVQSYARLMSISYETAFECFTRIINIKCFICHRGLSLDPVKTGYDPRKDADVQNIYRQRIPSDFKSNPTDFKCNPPKRKKL